MDTLFHFLFPIIAALAARIHVKQKLQGIIILVILTILLDADHFIGLERATFHNIFLTILIPILLIILSFELKGKYHVKGFYVILLVFLSSHAILDIFTEPGVALLYPFSNEYYRIEFSIPVAIPSQSTSTGFLVSSGGVGLLIYTLLILLPCLFLDEIIEIMERRHESFRKAFKDLTKI